MTTPPRQPGRHRSPPRKVWPRHGLTQAVTPSAYRRGVPLLPGYVWRRGDAEREEEVATFLADLRARRCPGTWCGRLARGHCEAVCAVPAIEPPTMPLTRLDGVA